MISKWIEHLDEWAESGDLALVKVKALLQSDTLNPTKLRELADEPQKGQYVRQVLHHHDGYELVLLRWGAGSETLTHDHGCAGTRGAVLIVDGMVGNRVFSEKDGKLTFHRSFDVPAGDVLTFGPGLIHQMVNAQPDKESMSIHVYFPCLEQVTYF